MVKKGDDKTKKKVTAAQVDRLTASMSKFGEPKEKGPTKATKQGRAQLRAESRAKSMRAKEMGQKYMAADVQAPSSADDVDIDDKMDDSDAARMVQPVVSNYSQATPAPSSVDDVDIDYKMDDGNAARMVESVGEEDGYIDDKFTDFGEKKGESVGKATSAVPSSSSNVYYRDHRSGELVQVQDMNHTVDRNREYFVWVNQDEGFLPMDMSNFGKVDPLYIGGKSMRKNKRRTNKKPSKAKKGSKRKSSRRRTSKKTKR